MAARQVPVTLVSGFVGAGKTALIEHLKKSLLSRRPAFLSDDGETDIFAAIDDAVEMRGADVIIIESVCHAEPFFAAEALEQGIDEEPPPKGIRLDTLVTVVDVSQFLALATDGADLLDTVEGCDPEDDRTVAEILIEQIEFADVVLLNKTDLANPSLIARTEALIERLNPRAKILRTIFAKVEASEIIGTGLFDMTETDDGAGWLAELQGEFDPADSSDSTEGVSSFTYIERRAFHPIRFNELLSDFEVEGLIRGKGSIWVASRHHEIGVWSIAGGSSTLAYGGAWFAATPAREWPTDERERAEIMNEWVPPFGDRRQEIAFIGIDMNEQEIRDRLNETLLTAQEIKDGPDGWFSIPDPLPDWHVD